MHNPDKSESNRDESRTFSGGKAPCLRTPRGMVHLGHILSVFALGSPNTAGETRRLGPLNPFVLAVMLLVATIAPAAAQDPIGTAVASYDLVNDPAGPQNSQPYGLAFDFVHYPRRLYVSDHSQPTGDYIFVYQIDAAGLVELTAERIFTFDDPRGLAFAYVNGVPYLYALESNTGSSGGLVDRLWRYDMVSHVWSNIDLGHPNFGVTGRELLGLEYRQGQVFIGYDTSGMTDAVRYGILRVKVDVEPGGTDWWALAGAADPSAIVGHMANGGRGPFTGTHYERDPCRGLAAMDLDGAFYLWGTSLGSYIYSAEGATGRGIFYFASPPDHDGVRRRQLYDLAFGDNYLWAVERTDDNHPNLIHKIKARQRLHCPTAVWPTRAKNYHGPGSGHHRRWLGPSSERCVAYIHAPQFE